MGVQGGKRNGEGILLYYTVIVKQTAFKIGKVDEEGDQASKQECLFITGFITCETKQNSSKWLQF